MTTPRAGTAEGDGRSPLTMVHQRGSSTAPSHPSADREVNRRGAGSRGHRPSPRCEAALEASGDRRRIGTTPALRRGGRGLRRVGGAKSLWWPRLDPLGRLRFLDASTAHLEVDAARSANVPPTTPDAAEGGGASPHRRRLRLRRRARRSNVRSSCEPRRRSRWPSAGGCSTPRMGLVGAASLRRARGARGREALVQRRPHRPAACDERTGR